jgi:hypothetical protein
MDYNQACRPFLLAFLAPRLLPDLLAATRDLMS